MTEQGAATGTGTQYQETKIYKFAVAVLGAVVLAGVSLANDGFSNQDWMMLVIAAATAANVWVAANLPDQTWIKAVVGLIGGLANLAVAYFSGDDITANEWWNLLVVALTTAGIIAIPNPLASASGRRVR